MIKFPPVDQANEDGLLAVGGSIDAPSLIEAYKRGIFPWPISYDLPVTWFSPDPRGIIFLDQFHQPSSVRKFFKNHPYQLKFNTRFSEVIAQCALVRMQNNETTWITPELIYGYVELYQKKLAYSVECFDGDQLIAGLYGVCIGEIISAESMFFKVSNTSKLCLTYLLLQLQRQGIKWVDTQMVSPTVALFGGKYIDRKQYIELLNHADKTLTRDQIFQN